MSKIAFSDKCHILGELWLHYREPAADNEEWSGFFAWADIALPLSYMIWQGLAESPNTEDGKHGRDLIDQTWDTFCKMIGIDPDIKYAHINEAWNASPNALLNNES
jgi:hypothetical protein